MQLDIPLVVRRRTGALLLSPESGSAPGDVRPVAMAAVAVLSRAPAASSGLPAAPADPYPDR